MASATARAFPWSSIRTVVTPAWFDEYVLAVGSVDAVGDPSAFSLAGPWVDVAAPGEDVDAARLVDRFDPALLPREAIVLRP